MKRFCTLKKPVEQKQLFFLDILIVPRTTSLLQPKSSAILDNENKVKSDGCKLISNVIFSMNKGITYHRKVSLSGK